ncbi:MAG TPA: dTDP-4-dehydrorhamnose 3,5-epimerase [Solirubrobacteraceae bacterium]|jgi:dTDP-4-dehydrorhamnose 3,5-epimerase|nr:dTDP-4-dehydrorhamnose 3,5-epimerase [Solirubrobacteraceae bacterium]
MRATLARLPGVRLIEPVVHADARGFFLESYRQDLLPDLGVADDWVQDNHSRSGRGVVRGMHFQPGMAKLVRCARGAIYDVVVDVQVDSPTFGQWEGFELTDADHRQVYCPDGFAHGFCVLSPEADVVYKTSAYWDPATEGGFVYNDPEVGIAWPAGLELTASAKDAAAPSLSQLVDRLREAQERPRGQARPAEETSR